MRDCSSVFNDVDDGFNIEVTEDGSLKYSYKYCSDNGNDIIFVCYDGYVDNINRVFIISY